MRRIPEFHETVLGVEGEEKGSTQAHRPRILAIGLHPNSQPGFGIRALCNVDIKG